MTEKTKKTGWPKSRLAHSNEGRVGHRMQAARDARVRIGEDTDYKLYGAISKKPGSSVYDLANELRWSAGKVYGSIKRLEKDGWIRTEKAERGGRSVLKIEPVKWHEFLTLEEIGEFKKGDSL